MGAQAIELHIYSEKGGVNMKEEEVLSIEKMHRKYEAIRAKINRIPYVAAVQDNILKAAILELELNPKKDIQAAICDAVKMNEENIEEAVRRECSVTLYALYGAAKMNA